MSRRIVLGLLAASAALTATPAFADRECFDKSCKLMPAVVEPPPSAPTAQAQPQELPNVPPETEAAEAHAEAPVRVLPRMVVDPAKREPALQPRYDDNAGPLRPAAPDAVTPKIVRPNTVKPNTVKPKTVTPRTTVREAAERPPVPVTEYRPALEAEDAPAAATERRPKVRVVHRSRPAPSYGYVPGGGAYGYRAEFGYRITPGYIIAPDARIITIEGND